MKVFLCQLKTWVCWCFLMLAWDVLASENRSVRLALIQGEPGDAVFAGEKSRKLFLNLCEEIARREGWKLQVDIIQAAPNDPVRAFENHDLVAPCPFFRDEGVTTWIFSEHTVVSSYAQVFNQEGETVESFMDLEGHSVGVLRETVYARQLREITERFNVSCQIVEFVDHQQIVEALANHWLDAGVLDHLFTMEIAIPDDVVASAIRFSPVELRFASVTHAGSDVLAALDYHLRNMIENQDSVYHQSVNQILAASEDTALLKWLRVALWILAALLGLATIYGVLLQRQVRWRTRELRDKNQDLTCEVLKRSEVEASLLRQKACLAALNETAVGLMGRLDVDDLLETMVTRVTYLFGTWHGFLLLSDADNQSFECRVGLGGFRPLVGAKWPQTQGLAGRILESRDLVCVRDYGCWEDRLHPELLDELQTVVGAPLCSKDQVVGVIGLGWFGSQRTLDRDELDILKRFAEMAIITLENARLHTALQTELHHRRMAEEDRSRLAAAVEQVTENVIIVNTRGQVDYVNRSYEMDSGRMRDAVLGRRLTQIGEQAIWKRIQPYLLNDSNEPRFSERSTATRADGTYYPAETTVSPLRVSDDEMSHLIIVRRDVTQHVHFERQQRHANKMEALGTLAGGIAHDFNNLLLPISGYSEMALKSLNPHSCSHEMLEEVIKATQRARDLVQQILAFGSKREEERRTIVIQKVVQEALSLSQISKPPNIAILKNISSEDFFVEADPTQIHQIVMNLTTNAFHAMQDRGGILEVGVVQPEPPGTPFEVENRLDQGGFLRITVRDTGMGMTQQVRDRIFDPYFTTKPGGNGMGLAVVHGIVHSYGGMIDVQSTLTQGTTMHIYLPTRKCARSEVPQLDSLEPPRGHEHILVVDDEEQVLRITTLMLKDLGYRVSARSDPIQAWNQFKGMPDGFDLLFTDHNMPSMSGLELADRVRSLNPNLPILLCTGRLDQETRQAAKKINIQTFFSKPFVWRDLATTVRRALDTPDKGIGDLPGEHPRLNQANEKPFASERQSATIRAPE